MQKNKSFYIKTLILIGIICAISFYFYQKSLVVVKDELEGLGNGVKNGQMIVFDYRGFLFDQNAPKNLGREFDSSYRRNQPMKLVLGSGQQIKGLDEGIVGMKAGGQRYITIKSPKAFDNSEAAGGLVPAGSKLIYLIELRSIQN